MKKRGILSSGVLIVILLIGLTGVLCYNSLFDNDVSFDLFDDSVVSSDKESTLAKLLVSNYANITSIEFNDIYVNKNETEFELDCIVYFINGSEAQYTFFIDIYDDYYTVNIEESEDFDEEDAVRSSLKNGFSKNVEITYLDGTKEILNRD